MKIDCFFILAVFVSMILITNILSFIQSCIKNFISNLYKKITNSPNFIKKDINKILNNYNESLSTDLVKFYVRHGLKLENLNLDIKTYNILKNKVLYVSKIKYKGN